MAMAFLTLEDSPMFKKQIHSLEQTTDELKDRCQKLQKGCKKFMASIGEAYHGDLSFADSLEAFGAGHDDPSSIAIGGPVMSRFITAFRELGSYKELVRTQVEHMLSNRLMQFINVDIQNVKECRRRFDKASAGYDQAREKFMSLKKGARVDIVAELEENLHNNKSAFERCRFNLVNALSNIEAKKKFEFLESISAVMDAHMRYFKQGYELLSQMEPFIHQVLTYTQHSKEIVSVQQDKLEKRIQQFRTQSELASLKPSSYMEATTSGDGIHVSGSNSYKNIEDLMQSTANGKVQIIKQGYLLKRSSSLRADWKRRFFVLDSHGTLYYYIDKWNKQQLLQQQNQLFHLPNILGNGLEIEGDDNLFHTVDLRTSTIKIDAEQIDLRFCFRIISPVKSFILQAENEADRMEWVEKIKGVIASLLNSTLSKQGVDMDSSCLTDVSGADTQMLEGSLSTKVNDNVSKILRNIPGNDACAECGAPEPEWASLNLGILVCIECSGVHRKLGVHISKVRSLTLDVKVWEPAVMDLFCALGNAYCNSVWEELLLFQDQRIDEYDIDLLPIKKPTPKDVFSIKEKYIRSKYEDKSLIVRETSESDLPPVTVRVWEAVKTNNVQVVYRLLVASDASPNTKYDQANHVVDTSSHIFNDLMEGQQFDPTTCQKITDSGDSDNCLQGCSLLHLACHVGDPVMLELLLQFGADINYQDFHGRTPLHHCVSARNNSLAKYLIRRGASTSVKDCGGFTALERAMEHGAIPDEELFILLADHL